MTRGAIFRILATVISLASLPVASFAQNSTRPVVLVNDRAVTQFEIDQRVKLLDLFGTRGNLRDVARRDLIDDRLKQQELERAGIRLSDADLALALEDFAQRANRNADQLFQLLAQNGVYPATVRDFVSIGVMWRDYIRLRFGDQVDISDADVRKVLEATQATPGELEVLLSEIIIAPPPEMMPRALEVAQQISQVRNYADFSDAARQLSALPSRENGGRIDWRPISSFPEPIANALLTLSPGQVTAPIEIPGGIALFQMRGIREGRAAGGQLVGIDYAMYYIPAGATAAARVAEVRDDVDSCDDLYGIAKGQPEQILERVTQAPSEIPANIAAALEGLDADESTTLDSPDGSAVVFLMLCSRNTAARMQANPQAIRAELTSRQLAALAQSLIEDLRAAAVIRN